MRRPAAVAGALFGVGGLVLLVVALIVGGRGESLTRADITAFENRMMPLIREGGKVVEMGLKVGIKDVNDGSLDPRIVQEQARIWETDFVRLHDQFDEVEAPGELQRVRASWVAAAAKYRSTAAAIQRAAEASDKSAREDLLDEAIRHGKDADDLFDQGSRHLQRLRVELGMPQNAELPNLSIER